MSERGDASKSQHGQPGAARTTEFPRRELRPNYTVRYESIDTSDLLQRLLAPTAAVRAEGLNPKMKDNITGAPLPQINPAKPATMAYSFDIVVNAKIAEPKQRVAWDFVHMAVYDPKMWLSNNGSLLPYGAWAGSSEARQTLQFFDVFVHDLSIGRPMVRTDHFNEFEDAIGRAIQRVVFTGADRSRVWIRPLRSSAGP